MRVLDDRHSCSCGLCCWFERKYTVAIFFFFLSSPLRFIFLMILGTSFVSCHYSNRRLFCLDSLFVKRKFKITENSLICTENEHYFMQIFFNGSVKIV